MRPISINIKNVMRLLAKLGVTAHAILPAKVQVRHLQQLQIEALKFSGIYQAKLQLGQEVQNECIRNLTLSSGRPLILPPPDLLMRTDALTKGWALSCQGISTWGPWSKDEQNRCVRAESTKGES